MKLLKQWTSAEMIAFVKSVDKKTWLMVLSSVAGFFLIVIAVIVPAWIARPLLWRDIQNMEAQILLVNTLNQKRPEWEEKKKILGPLIEETPKRVFTVESLGTLLGQISKMASESRVDVLASRPLVESAVFAAPYDLKYQPVGYEFKVQGGFYDLCDLAKRIETHEKLLRIRSLEIMPSEKTPFRHISGLKLWAIVKAPPQKVASAKASKGKNAKK